MKEIIFPLFLSGFLVWILTPLARRLGFRFGILDYSDHKAIPCTGGVAIYASFFGSIILISPCLSLSKDLVSLTIGGTLLLGLGIYDDRKGLTALKKLFAQSAISLIVILLGLKITALAKIQLGWAGFPISLLWFLGFINAINLIDGLDGLASGITAITTLVLLLLSPSPEFLILVAALAGATLFFLRFNLSKKRKIFLGDNGSMLLGFLLAGLSIVGSHKGRAFDILAITLICLGVPICDTALAILRRRKKKVSIFSRDKEHIHHQLLNKGMSQKEALLLIYGITLVVAVIGLCLIR
ncbi:undecaprenyl/decaprenyl-phosphate alpha-N-acetylglucosaminyl 1-phosphate transferase [bacterium]|nr:undecaprenyl/decaprenyl-phosphate alpha-N-acetylglucosaminyl 1-phosphate transferase [bacterium]